MAKYASKVVEQAKAWLGRNEYDGTHREIINVYNAHKPLARGYKVTYQDAWCATFVSAVAIKLGYTDIIPTECGCSRMIDLFKKLGAWVENDDHKPKPGDIIFYDWDDSGKGDNAGGSDHVGIVEKVAGSTITVIEGNYKNAVTRRNIAVNGRYIRGYGVPKYDAEVAAKPSDPAGKNLVKEFQEACIADGIKLPKYGADGYWGKETATAAAHLLKNGSKGARVKLIQKLVGTTVDGVFGKETRAAVKSYQSAKRLAADGVVGINTWKSLLEV